MSTLFYIILIILIIRTMHYMRIYNVTLLHAVNRLYLRHLWLRIAYTIKPLSDTDSKKYKFWYLLVGCHPDDGYGNQGWSKNHKQYEIIKYKA